MRGSWPPPGADGGWDRLRRKDDDGLLLLTRTNAEKTGKRVRRRREAKATTLSEVRLARSCEMGGRMWCERLRVKGIDEAGIRFASNRRVLKGTEGARLRSTRRAVAFAKMYPTVSDFALEAVEEKAI